MNNNMNNQSHEKCAFCHETTHPLRLCMKADKQTGFIHGCAVCNEIHPMGNCPDYLALSPEAQYNLVVLGRGRMPPLDVDERWTRTVARYDAQASGPLPAPEFLPWTRDFTIKWISDIDSNNMKRAIIDRFYRFGERAILPVDPLTRTLAVAWRTASVGFSLRRIGKACADASENNNRT
ncbi:hypothetical protein JDV02_003888 [Purpureocillium takamizusanense]|uniref:Uncharacterized protein n=1 Tax=Purpureocillium takamizusanense TaxID=2060973 RepID=A0A9Q8VA89_9HYPO|nr:uncharacterized protein JDV02_003888 [Purpureocillium takamizusanense]UNI17556.1 hypothetical protein JDV02_003888 [Purpureocillium takamizusanense]